MINKKLRLEVINYYQNICQYCRRELESRDLCVHHLDGNNKNNKRRNLICFCKRCHMRVHHVILKKDINKVIENLRKDLQKTKYKDEIEFIKIRIKLLEDDFLSKERPEVLRYLGDINPLSNIYREANDEKATNSLPTLRK